MGTGSDIAMQSAEITLIKGDLNGIARAKDLSKDVMWNIKENLFFAFVYNFPGVPIATGVLFPVFEILFSPMIAAAAMSFSSALVIANVLRLRRKWFSQNVHIRKCVNDVIFFENFVMRNELVSHNFVLSGSRQLNLKFGFVTYITRK